jgi:hypothetical protein
VGETGKGPALDELLQLPFIGCRHPLPPPLRWVRFAKSMFFPHC